MRLNLRAGECKNTDTLYKFVCENERKTENLTAKNLRVVYRCEKDEHSSAEKTKIVYAPHKYSKNKIFFLLNDQLL